jgi:DNA polymerase-3 subunit alpha
LETLPVLHGCLASIQRAGIDFDLKSIDLNDKRVYDMLCGGDVSGVFQLSNQASKVIAQRPRNFKDLIAINALIRPGTGDWDEYLARRNGKEWSVHESRMPYLQETEGLITYQEQFLLDAKVLAGWDIAYADKHIRKNKNIRDDETLREKFYTDTKNNGYTEEICHDVWEEICDAVAGGYSFNKSHSASYAMLSYQTAYLKCYYPEHFYASLMSGEKTDGDGQNAISSLIAECKQRNIHVLPPDINHSGNSFVASHRGIHYRLTTIKHVGDSAVEWILANRPFASFADFLEKRDTSIIKKNIIINLIKAGAFDSFNENREQLIWEFDMTQRTKTQIKKGIEVEHGLYNDDVKMLWEKEVLGMYLSTHPMEKYGFKNIEEYAEDSPCLQGGEVVEVYDFHPQKNPAKPKMAWITINTLYGTIKVVVFARDWARVDVQELFFAGNIVLIRGKRQGKDVLFNSGEILERK